MGVFNPLLFAPSRERQGKCRDFKDCNSLHCHYRVQAVRRQFLVVVREGYVIAKCCRISNCEALRPVVFFPELNLASPSLASRFPTPLSAPSLVICSARGRAYSRSQLWIDWVLICSRQPDAASRHGLTLEFEQPPLAGQRPSD